jgi:hypothetical protein
LGVNGKGVAESLTKIKDKKVEGVGRVWREVL